MDIVLIRGIQTDRVRQAIVRGITSVCQELATMVVAEGVETQAEFQILKSFGIRYFQGYYFARPAFQALPSISAGVLDG